jgi:O-antigen ligase
MALVALVGVALAKTGARSGLVVAALGTLVLVGQSSAFLPRAKRYLMLGVAAVVMAITLTQIPTVVQRLAEVESGNVKRVEPRARMFPVLWDMFLRHPWLGSGPDRYQLELTRRALPGLMAEGKTISSHHLALMQLVETGLLGFTVFSVGLALAVRAAWRARKQPCGWLPLAMLLPLVIAGLTISNPSYMPAYWLAIAYGLAGRA